MVIDNIKIEIAYAGLENQVLRSLLVKRGATLREAILASTLLKDFPELGDNIEELNGRVGIFGEVLPLDTELMEGDRLEIYRELQRNPKEARKVRAEESKTPPK